MSDLRDTHVRKRTFHPLPSSTCMVATVKEVSAASSLSEFEVFFLDAWPKVRAFAISITREVASAEDVAQESLTRTFARWKLLRRPLGFALRTARNLTVDHQRQRAREITSDVVEIGVTFVSSNHELWEQVTALPDAQRDVVVLHYFLDLRLSDIATILRCPLGTVKRRLHDARNNLSLAMEEDDA